MKKLLCLALSMLLLTLPLVSCGKVPGGNITETTSPESLPPVTPTDAKAAGDLLLDYVSEIVTEKKADDKFVKAMLDFSAELFRNTVDRDKKNSLISPLSVIVALGMASCGSNGETRAQFEYDYSIGMNDALKSMGLTDAFSPASADLSGMGESDGKLYIGSVLHKTHIEMKAAGTRAAAVTAITVTTTSCNPIIPKKYSVKLDKPFVYLIVDSASNIPVFMGVVTSVK